MIHLQFGENPVHAVADTDPVHSAHATLGVLEEMDCTECMVFLLSVAKNALILMFNPDGVVMDGDPRVNRLTPEQRVRADIPTLLEDIEYYARRAAEGL